MILIGSSPISESFISRYPINSVESNILQILSSSSQVYRYGSQSLLEFELSMRANMVSASRELHRSGLSFRVFRRSICNPDFWERTQEGGFSLKEGVAPSSAIRDIFQNGSQYGTECATAIVMIYFKAILNVFSDTLFNRVFTNIYLMNWENLDKNLALSYYSTLVDYLPGNCRYFKNPDVNPMTPEWQGENVIDLGGGLYYGHGIGIKTADEIIRSLNYNRRSGATESAYLLDSVNTLGFTHLFNIYSRQMG
ncbi:MAG: protein-glutamine gamma-glutamyltransferase [Thermotaleaceae bacterium]